MHRILTLKTKEGHRVGNVFRFPDETDREVIKGIERLGVWVTKAEWPVLIVRRQQMENN